uniref:Secreted protein n=1 Tax=Steinernema glaseri TaxID=37863 RepID=A0A1I8A0C1_9BILA
MKLSMSARAFPRLVRPPLMRLNMATFFDGLLSFLYFRISLGVHGSACGHLVQAIRKTCSMPLVYLRQVEMTNTSIRVEFTRAPHDSIRIHWKADLKWSPMLTNYEIFITVFHQRSLAVIRRFRRYFGAYCDSTTDSD